MTPSPRTRPGQRGAIGSVDAVSARLLDNGMAGGRDRLWRYLSVGAAMLIAVVLVWVLTWVGGEAVSPWAVGGFGVLLGLLTAPLVPAWRREALERRRRLALTLLRRVAPYMAPGVEVDVVVDASEATGQVWGAASLQAPLESGAAVAVVVDERAGAEAVSYSMSVEVSGLSYQPALERTVLPGPLRREPLVEVARELKWSGRRLHHVDADGTPWPREQGG